MNKALNPDGAEAEQDPAKLAACKAAPAEYQHKKKPRSRAM
ncbi:hypothetical protein ACIOJD_34100 [Streptomyces sp. NPDC088116]